MIGEIKFKNFFPTNFCRNCVMIQLEQQIIDLIIDKISLILVIVNDAY